MDSATITKPTGAMTRVLAVFLLPVGLLALVAIHNINRRDGNDRARHD